MSNLPANYWNLVDGCKNTTYKLADELFFFVPLIYGIPTIFLHVNIAMVIVIKRHDAVLKLAFFKICAVYSMLMVVMWCFDMVSTRFIGIGYFCEDLLYLWGKLSYTLSPVQFIMTYSRHAQFYGAAVISINRMTAVLFPAQYKSIWERHWITFMMLMFLLPLLTTWYLISTLTKLIPYTLGGLTIKYVKIMMNPLCSISFTTMLVASISALIILCTTVVTYSKLASHKNHHGSRIDKNLLIISMISSVSTSLLAIAEVPLYLSINYAILSPKHFFISICVKQIVIDITFIFSAWSITFLSSSVRCSILQMYFKSMRGRTITADNAATTTKINNMIKSKAENRGENGL